MRRTLTPCAVTSDGNYLPLKRAEFTDRRIVETFLQEALNQNPALLPIDEIDTAFGPLTSIGREIASIDNLFISPTGRLTLVETKLWRNPESGREVVGQVLDYASTLSAWSYEELQRQAQCAVQSPLGSTEPLYEHVKRAFPRDVLGESEFIDAVQKTLRTGRFLLLIVGDGIREGVERMLGHLHDHPQRLFTFGLVEMGIYENPAVFPGRILIPSLVAKTTEVVRAVVQVETAGPANVSVITAREDEEIAGGYHRRTLSEDEFLRELPDQTTRQLYERLFVFAAELGAEKTWRASSVSLRLPDPNGSDAKLTLVVLTTAGELYIGYLNKQLERVGLPKSISLEYANKLSKIFGVPTHRRHPGSLSHELRVAEVLSHYDEFVDAIKEAVVAIRKAAAGAGQTAR